jgi:tRNA threonylcarbamoyladenosine modification (KEOPS) complex Cgi121 subunit
MLKLLEEFGKYVEISGFKGVKVGDARAFVDAVCGGVSEDVEVQLFDADLVAGWEHLYFAALNALSAFRSGRNLSKSLAVESALYASSQRQIKKALDFIGVKSESMNVAVLIFGENVGSVEAGLLAVASSIGRQPDEGVLKLFKAKIKRIRGVFDVSEAELKAASNRDASKALVDLVVERVALLSTRL